MKKVEVLTRMIWESAKRLEMNHGEMADAISLVIANTCSKTGVSVDDVVELIARRAKKHASRLRRRPAGLRQHEMLTAGGAS